MASIISVPGVSDGVGTITIAPPAVVAAVTGQCRGYASVFATEFSAGDTVLQGATCLLTAGAGVWIASDLQNYAITNRAVTNNSQASASPPPPPPPTILLEDNFVAADDTQMSGRSLPLGTLLPKSWTAAGTPPAPAFWVIRTNELKILNVGDAYAVTDSGLGDVKIRAKIHTPNDGNGWTGILARSTVGISGGILFGGGTRSNIDNNTGLYIKDGAALDNDGFNLSYDTYYWFELICSGTSITGNIYAADGTTLLSTYSATSSHQQAFTYVGLRQYRDGSNYQGTSRMADWVLTAP